MTDQTADKLVEGIEKVLHDGEIAAVEMFLRLLAVRDPQRAQDVVDLMRLGLDLRAASEDSGRSGREGTQA